MHIPKTGAPIYFFFSGEMEREIPSKTVMNYVEEYNPKLHYYQFLS